MTVPSEQSSIQYDADGVSVFFPVPFRFIQDQHLRVTLLHAGVETVLVLGSDYTVAGANDPAGGSITTTTAYPLGDELTIERIVPITQETAYQRNDPFPERAHEQALDKLTMICQQIANWFGWGSAALSRVLMLGRFDVSGSGAYRANGNRITNLGDPKADTDAVNRRSMFSFVTEYVDRSIAGVAGGFGFFLQSGAGAVPRTFQDKMREWVSVEDFRSIVDADDTAAFERACSLGCTVIAAGSSYKLKGEFALASGTDLQFTRNPLIEMDLSGENGRGMWIPPGVTGAMISGSARIIARVDSAGSDGTRNGVFTIASNYYVSSDPLRIARCAIVGNFDVHMLGPVNGKAVQIYGYVEDILVQGVRARGQSSFAFAAHWIGNGAAGVLPTKTWHPHRIVFRDCEARHDGTGALLRGFTVSAGGHVIFDNCHTLDVQTLGFNIFVGDYGYTYAQNLGQTDAFDVSINDCTHSGTSTALSADGVSSRLNGSPQWSGAAHRAALKIDGFLARMKPGANSLDVAVTGLRSLSARALRVIEEADGNTQQAVYLTSISNVDVQGEVIAKGGVLVRDCTTVVDVLHGLRVVETHDTAGYIKGASALSEVLTTTAATPAGGTSVALSSPGIVTGPGGILRYNDGSRSYEMELRSMTYAGAPQSITIAPAPVAIPAGASVTLIQTVRSLTYRDQRLSGARFLASFTGSAAAKVRNVKMLGVTFLRGGVTNVNAAAVNGLLLSGCFHDYGGQTTTTTSTSSVLLGSNAEKFRVIGDHFGENNTRIRYHVQCHDGSKDGLLAHNMFCSINTGATNPAAIFKGAASNVVIGTNNTLPGITPVYP